MDLEPAEDAKKEIDDQVELLRAKIDNNHNIILFLHNIIDTYPNKEAVDPHQMSKDIELANKQDKFNSDRILRISRLLAENNLLNSKMDINIATLELMQKGEDVSNNKEILAQINRNKIFESQLEEFDRNLENLNLKEFTISTNSQQDPHTSQNNQGSNPKIVDWKIDKTKKMGLSNSSEDKSNQVLTKTYTHKRDGKPETKVVLTEKRGISSPQFKKARKVDIEVTGDARVLLALTDANGKKIAKSKLDLKFKDGALVKSNLDFNCVKFDGDIAYIEMD